MEKLKKIIQFILLILMLQVSNYSIAQNNIKLKDGDIIVRNIIGSDILKHYGVVYKNKIVEFNQTGLHHSSLDEFLCNKKIIHIDSTLRNSKDTKLKIENAIKEYKNKPYSLKNNCESFITYVKKGVPTSLQYEIIDYLFQTINFSIMNKPK